MGHMILHMMHMSSKFEVAVKALALAQSLLKAAHEDHHKVALRCICSDCYCCGVTASFRAAWRI